MACLPFAAFLALSLLAEAHGAAGLGAPLAAMHRDAVGLPHVQELHAALGRLCATLGVCRPPRKPLLNLGSATPAPKGSANLMRPGTAGKPRVPFWTIKIEDFSEIILPPQLPLIRQNS